MAMASNVVEVVIVGAGPSGLAIAACLTLLSISSIILERDDCHASLWKKRTYDRLKLHLAKKFCALPHMPFPRDAPTFISRDGFIKYLDRYVDHFKLSPRCSMQVELASYDEANKTWCIKAMNKVTGMVEQYASKFLVVASGENNEGFIPDILGQNSFSGEMIHSSLYRSGAPYNGKSVLVVGSGNSGMEIAYDLSNHGAKTSISIRSPLHVMTKEIIYLGMVLVQYLPVAVVDALLVLLAKFTYGDLSKYGIVRPAMGPLSLKEATGRSAVIDVGTVGKIKTGEIQVVKEPTRINANEVEFSDGKTYQYDSIIFATGYKSLANTWLKDDTFLLGEDGFPRQRFPNHWKGKNGLYCVGLARRGLAGVSSDAIMVSNDIASIINASKEV